MSKPNAFSRWLNTFISEKGLDLDTIFEVVGPTGTTNWIPAQCIVDLMHQTSPREQAGIKAMIVRIDFANGNVMDYFKHLAKAVAK